jgi:uncharacterized membrane protein YphA (DoxX/SURF4 family)
MSKSTKIIYWTTTGLFAAFMAMSGVPNILKDAESIKFITHLGYPEYFIPFIGVGKVLGAIAILIPSFKKLKEWAYAGLFFDLIAATYSLTIIDGFQPSMLVMIVILGVAALSYIYNDKMYGDSEI